MKTFIVCRKTFLKQSFVYRKTRFEKILFLKHFLLKTFENIYVVFLKFRVSPFFWKQIFYFKNCFWKQIFFGFEKQLLKTDFFFFFFWKQIFYSENTFYILKTDLFYFENRFYFENSFFFLREKKKSFRFPFLKKKNLLWNLFFFFKLRESILKKVFVVKKLLERKSF